MRWLHFSEAEPRGSSVPGRAWDGGGVAWALLALLALVAPSARAELRVPQPRADLGDLRGGANLVRRFPLVNAGAQALTITDAKASCGCLKPRLSKDTLQPGEEGWVEVEVNTLSQPAGPNAWRVDLKYQAGEKSGESAILITATLSKEISVEPASLNIYTDQQIVHDICVTDFRSKPLNVTAVRTSSPHLQATLKPPAQDMQGRAVRIVKLQVGADYPEGKREEIVSLYTDDAAYPELKVAATIVKRAKQRVIVAPAEVTLSGQPLPSRIVLVRDTENQPVVVEKVTAEHAAVSAKWVAGPNNNATVRVSADQALLNSPTLTTKLHIHVSAPAAQVIVVPVTILKP